MRQKAGRARRDDRVAGIDELIHGAAGQCAGQVGVHTELNLHVLHTRNDLEVADGWRTARARAAHQALAAQRRDWIAGGRQGGFAADVETVDDQLVGGRLGGDEPGRERRAGKQLPVAEAGRLDVNHAGLQGQQRILAHPADNQRVRVRRRGRACERRTVGPGVTVVVAAHLLVQIDGPVPPAVAGHAQARGYRLKGGGPALDAVGARRQAPIVGHANIRLEDLEGVAGVLLQARYGLAHVEGGLALNVHRDGTHHQKRADAQRHHQLDQGDAALCWPQRAARLPSHRYLDHVIGT